MRNTLQPTFLGIGAAKCGTTTLAHHLRRHPEIAFPRSGRKEMHFFDEGDVTTESLRAYRAEFDPGRVSGEITPAYIFDPRCPGLIRDALGPDLKLLVLLRDPVDRAWSHYWHAVREWYKPEYRPRGYPVEDLSFEEAIEAEPARLASGKFHIRHQSYFSKGLYDEQLDRWFERFDRSQFWIGLNEDLALRPREMLNEVSAFLGVRPFGEIPPTRLNSMTPPGAGIPIEARARLVKRYLPSIDRLEVMLARDLGAWKQIDAVVA